MNTNVSAEWERFEKAKGEANRRNRTLVFDALSKAGITHVCVEFDGEGDQGLMEEAVAQSHGSAVEFPAVTLAIRALEFRSPEPIICELRLKSAVEYLCYGHLEDQHGGWEIDEGSFGRFTFDVAARTISLDFYGRIVVTEHSDHRF